MALNDQFSIDIKKFIEKCEDKADQFSREFPQDLAEAVISSPMHPVVSGNLRANWTAAIGAPDLAVKEGGDPMARIALNLSSAKAGDTIFINNNAPYAMRMEYGFVGADSLGRTYNQTGRGWVRAIVSRANEVAQKTLQRITKA